jgi:hypothetical protein
MYWSWLKIVCLTWNFFGFIVDRYIKEFRSKNDMDLISKDDINSKIHAIRGKQVMLDRDLAEIYNVKTKRLNEQVKRNINRFPERYMFQLNNKEKEELVANCDRLRPLKHSLSKPYAFTEQGIAMLSSVLNSIGAIEISIKIIDAFVAMRHFLLENNGIFQKFQQIDQKFIEYDGNFNKIFKAIESKQLTPNQGIFYGGQIYDAYKFAVDLIKQAKNDIILIDNFIDESVLTLLSNKKKDVKATIYTSIISESIILAKDKFNKQYSNLEIKGFRKSHDRFLIIDNGVYHIGASLKDLGKKWFAFSRMAIDMINILR